MTKHNPGKIIWTAAAIGAKIGRGADFVRNTLAELPGSPVRRMGKQFYAFEAELIDFLRQGTRKPTNTDLSK